MTALRRLRLRLRPTTIAGQIALLVVAGIAVAHVVATIAFLLLHEPQNPDELPGVAASRLGTLARLLDAVDPAARPALLASGHSLPLIRVESWDGTVPPGAKPVPDLPVIHRLRNGAGRPVTITDLSDGDPEQTRSPARLHIGIVTPAGAMLQATLPNDPLRTPKQGALIFTVVFLALTLALLSVWATRALTAPLKRLAGAAEAFGTRDDHVALPEAGPREVLAVSRALDRMRSRVRRLIDDRTQMLAAISHDLRTPITRLRLRAEFIEDDTARAATLRDLDQMNGLVETALSFVRDGQTRDTGSHSLVDLASVVQTVCDDFSDFGAPVSVGRSRHVLVQGRPEELQRAVTNLVDNAIKYGGRAEVHMDASERGVRVCVLDQGPGIPEAEREAMLQPFVRGDRARNLNEASGFGLGLSIVQAIVEAHNGRLTLENRREGGLCAAIELPLAAQTFAGRREQKLAPMPAEAA
ncbi:Adaptive-response sensory-kinase SasA [Methylobacterium tardum]|uniref:histidine kinase n=1 Tax=Methylobacterium tardum TaxID=374432 RepID=A0AA37WSV2_9HYPH|nr:ATP-binding protein [Methylobacterium tardum]URD37302.1 ATP-binding protein [Methylobacterium tardum]GJE51783.1 Adaptive-response sensory-kinase SasA [Methylobacterium tardum]GLS70812.1 two-component sensor histidine kinase [Methylobacterium tardum]